jgi:amidase
VYGGCVDWVVRYWAAETGRLPEPEELGPLTRLYWQRGREVRAGELMMAVTTVQQFARDVAAAYDGPDPFDVWLSPTLAEPPPRLDEMRATEEDPTLAEARSAAFVAFPLITANLTGRPAMSVPSGWSSDGLPIGMDYLGRFGDEATLFRLAAELEAARPWAGLSPPVSARCLDHHHPTASASGADSTP